MKKMKQSDIPRSVDEYLAGVPEPARSTLQKMRKAIQAMVPPEAIEAISYRMPTFRYKGALVCYAAFADHCSLFPMDASLIVKFKKELKSYSTAKGTIRFPANKPLPVGLLKKIIKARIARNTRRHRQRGK
jgi:uncharacterized protein YdhG (YjbR/CyaY superfamily)